MKNKHQFHVKFPIFVILVKQSIRTVLRNDYLHIDENFLKVHPDLASLFKEVKEKESALNKLKAKKKALKEEIKAAKSELSKRMNALEAWKMKGQAASRPKPRSRRQAL